MLFLYVFGNSVEDRLGRIAYLAFYLGGGVVAGVGHALAETAPVLGASGSVAAVTGAFLVLFPLTHITIVYWLIVIGRFEVSSLLLILFQIVQNVVFHFLELQPVAHVAHLTGYAYGFVIALLLLLGRLLRREPYDLLAMLHRQHRRWRFRRMASSGYNPWEHAPVPEPATVSSAPPLTEHQRQVLEVRVQVQQQLTAGDGAATAELYRRLLDLDPSQVLPQRQQLDLANGLVQQQEHELAGRAYEMWLNTYDRQPERPQVQLMLGVLCTRYLQRRQRARELLTQALPRLTDAGEQTLARRLLLELEGPAGPTPP
jgi:tetratricopeptide (TPR) repeat protein